MTSTYLKAIILVFLLLMFNACEDEATDASSSCDVKAIISDEFDTATTDAYTIISASLERQCLAVEIGAGGCSGQSWKADLLVSKVVGFSYPSYVSLKLILEDDELCEAAIRRTFHFDLQPLEEFGERLILNLDGWDEAISYPEIDTSNIQGTWNLINVNGGLAGIDDAFDKGQIEWIFNASDVQVINKNTDKEKQDAFESGTYPYSVIDEGNQSYWSLQVNEINLGAITFLSQEKLVVDQRAVDGFQYIFEK